MKPNVFPSDSASPNDNKKVQVDSDYEAEKLNVANEVYTNAATNTGFDAIEEMRQRTAEQMRLRDLQLKKNTDDIANYQSQMETAQHREPTNTSELAAKVNQQSIPDSPVKIPTKMPTNMPSIGSNFLGKAHDETRDAYIDRLSQPHWNMSFDVLPLPSEGKLYKVKKPTVKVAYMTTADENILTSPNLLQSGEFLEILINRKLLDTNLRYKDLHIGDRNAIMLWLRASSYGEMYPVTLLDENDVPFETEINLNELKTKKLNAEPDADGLFSFTLPQSKSVVRFKLLNVGEMEEIQKIVEEDAANDIPVDSTATYMLERQIIEVDGESNKDFIKGFIETLRLRDGKALKEYINSIDCGVELELVVRTPGGGSITTFLPLNVKFFWPNLSI